MARAAYKEFHRTLTKQRKSKEKRLDLSCFVKSPVELLNIPRNLFKPPRWHWHIFSVPARETLLRLHMVASIISSAGRCKCSPTFYSSTFKFFFSVT